MCPGQLAFLQMHEPCCAGRSSPARGRVDGSGSVPCPSFSTPSPALLCPHTSHLPGGGPVLSPQKGRGFLEFKGQEANTVWKTEVVGGLCSLIGGFHGDKTTCPCSTGPSGCRLNPDVACGPENEQHSNTTPECLYQENN